MNYKSQLGYILDLIEITGKDLASAINVDRTLVSKWKNNARPIKPNNNHFGNLIEAIIFFNNRRKDSILERFFGRIYPNEDKNEPEYLEVCLTLWLDGKDLGNFDNLNDWRVSKSALYATHVEVYQGNPGKRNAILDFFDYALTLPPGQEIFISDLDNQAWLYEDQHFSQMYHKRFMELIHCGHNITIVHALETFDTHPKHINFERFKMYYTGHVTSYYSTRRERRSSESSLYIIHRHMSLSSHCPDGPSENRHTMIQKDPFSVQHNVRIFVKRMKQAEQMISTFSSQGGKLKGFLQDFYKQLKPTDIFYSAPQIPLALYPESLLQEILNEHNISQELIENVEKNRLQQIKQLHRFVDTHTVEVLISQRILEEDLSLSRIKLHELSSLCKQDIYLSNATFRNSLQLITQSMQAAVNLSVMNFEDTHILDEVTLWLFEDQMMYSKAVEKGLHYVVSHAPVVLENISNYLKQLLMEHEENNKLIDYI